MRGNILRISIAIGCAAIISSCAGPVTRTPEVTSVQAEIEAKKQRELVVRSRVEQNRRLNDIAFRILKNGADLCKDKTRYRTGLSFWNLSAVDNEWTEAYRKLFNLSNLIQISSVAADSPAQTAGFSPGDIVLAVNNWPMPIGDGAKEKIDEKLKELKDSSAPLSVSLKRGEQTLSLIVTPAKTCDFSVALSDADTINAFADGERIVITRKMMDFFKTDEETALVLSHELAHNSMGHVQSQKQNAVVGGLIGLVIDIAAAAGGVNTQGQFTDIGMRAGAAAYSVDFEREADYVGLYLMARSGYTIKDAPNFWRRMAVQSPGSIQLKATHPTSPERFVALEKTIDEISLKQQAKLALIPELKEKNAFDSDESAEEIVDTRPEATETGDDSVALVNEDSPDESAEEASSSDPISSFFGKIFGRNKEEATDDASQPDD